jgi:hypothetical protein
LRYRDWKVSFAINSHGNIATAMRETPSWAMITNLRMDPYERGMDEVGEAMKFFGQQMWLLVPIQNRIKEFFSDFEDFPYQPGSSLNAAGIGYGLLRQQEAMKRLKDVEGFAVAGGSGHQARSCGVDEVSAREAELRCETCGDFHPASREIKQERRST